MHKTTIIAAAAFALWEALYTTSHVAWVQTHFLQIISSLSAGRTVTNSIVWMLDK